MMGNSKTGGAAGSVGLNDIVLAAENDAFYIVSDFLSSALSLFLSYRPLYSPALRYPCR